MNKTKADKLIEAWVHADNMLRAYLEGLKNGMKKECDCEPGVEETVALISETEDMFNTKYCTACGGFIEW
jgi:hypothetical protein